MSSYPKIKAYDVMPFCRCGRKTDWGSTGHPECPAIRSRAQGALFTYHDMVAQLFGEQPNWTVEKEPDGRYRAVCNAWEKSPTTHAKEISAWRELDKVQWGEIEWPEHADEADFLTGVTKEEAA